MFSRKIIRFGAAGAAAVAVALGGFAIGNSGSGNGTSSAANAAQAAAPGHGPRAGHAPQSGRASGSDLTAVSGQIPKNWQPGTGTIITGTAADKAKAAAVAADAQGTVNRVLKLGDGSYVVHLIATSGPHHVFVGKDFKVTGIA